MAKKILKLRRQPVIAPDEAEVPEDMPAKLGFQSGVMDLPDEPAPRQAGGLTVTPEADGGITLDLGEGEDDGDEDDGTATPSKFDSNLADKLSYHEQINLGETLKELVDSDIQSRVLWERRMKRGLQIIGMEDIPDDEVAFIGAAQVTHPGLAEAMVQFQARAMDEVMPPTGPVKCGVIGKADDDKEAAAERVEDAMNYQLMTEDDEYYTETDNMLLYLPYAGSAFRKVAIDPVIGRPRARFVPAADFIVPSWATSLRTSPRYTHHFTMPLDQFKRAVARGYYVDANFDHLNSQMARNEGDQTTKTMQEASDKTTSVYHEDDVDLEFYEMTVNRTFDWDDRGVEYDVPYVITFEAETCQVVRIVRCWKEEDKTCQKDVWYTHYRFLPGLGFYGWGYLHVIGGLGIAASGALRLLLDGSATASLQGGFKSRESRAAGEMQLSPGQWKDVDMTAEELAKSFYTPPFKEPSPALFKTLEILINSIQRFASTTEQMVGDTSAQNAPVGTTLALIEQGSKIFSGIHKRIHQAQGHEFRQIRECHYRYMTEEKYPFEVEGASRYVMRDDFNPDFVSVQPVSDPNIFSNVQRIATAQAAVAMVNQRPDVFSKEATRHAYRALVKALKLPDPDKYVPEKDVLRMDPVNENIAVTHGSPINVFVEQDDTAHNQIHMQYLQTVVASMDPQTQQRVAPALQAHIAAHQANHYRKQLDQQLMQSAGVPLPPYDPNNPDDNKELPPDIENTIARAVARMLPPPPPPQQPPDPEAGKDMLAERKAARDDMLAQRKAQRDDMAKMAELRREGFIPDLPPTSAGPPQQGQPPMQLPPGGSVTPPAQ